MANRRNTRGANRDARQLSFVVREPEARSEPDKFALLIPPPRSPVSAIRRLDLAARWAADLGELADVHDAPQVLLAAGASARAT